MNNIIGLIEQAGHSASPTGNPDEYIISCPTCSKKKLYINPDRRCWICFSCSEGGGLRKLFELLGISFHIEIKPDLQRLRALISKHKQEKPQKLSFALPKEFTPLSQNKTSFMGKKTYSFLEKRGLDPNIVSELWNIGYCTTGLYAGHLIVPVTDEDNNVISFQGRRLFGEGPKNKNPFGSGEVIFNSYHARNYKGIILVEGPWDAMSVHMRLMTYGISALALLGHNCSVVQASIISYIMKPEIVWVYMDPDVEISEMTKIKRTLIGAGIKDARIIQLPCDPDEAKTQDILDELELAEELA